MKFFKNINIKKNTVEVIKKYPFVLIGIYAIGILLVLLNHTAFDNEDTIIKITICIGLFAANALIFNAFKQQFSKFSRKWHIISLAVSAAACAAYYYTIDVNIAFSMVRTAAIFIAQACVFVSIPFINEDEKTEHFTNLLAGRMIITMAMFYVAWGGISGILFALEELFSLYIPNELYIDTPIILATTFVPMVWLYGISYDIKPKTTKLYRILLVYVLMTLLIAYTAVVYGYILKIALSGFVMPRSIICNLVMWYSLVGMIVYYLSRSYAKDSYGKFFITWYPRASVLPLIIMFISLFMRVNQYGYTINRIYMLLAGVFLSVMTLYILYAQITKRNIRHTFIPLLIAIIAIISIIEPFSANTLALKSQQAQLNKLVESYKAGSELDIDALSNEDCLRAQSIVRYISDNTEMDYPRNYESIDAMTSEQAKELMERYCYEEENEFNIDGYYYDSVQQKNEYVDIEDYKYLIKFNDYNMEIELPHMTITTSSDTYDNDDNRKGYGRRTLLQYTPTNDKTHEIDVSQLYIDVLNDMGKDIESRPDYFTVIVDENNYSFKFVMTNIDMLVYEDGEYRVTYLDGYVLIK